MLEGKLQGHYVWAAMKLCHDGPREPNPAA